MSLAGSNAGIVGGALLMSKKYLLGDLWHSTLPCTSSSTCHMLPLSGQITYGEPAQLLFFLPAGRTRGSSAPVGHPGQASASCGSHPTSCELFLFPTPATHHASSSPKDALGFACIHCDILGQYLRA